MKKNVVKIANNTKISINKDKVSLSTNNKMGSAKIDSKGKICVNIKTPIKGLNFKKCISFFK